MNGSRPGLCARSSAGLISDYFHWLIDLCGQLEALQRYGQAVGEEPALLVRRSAPGFVGESLALLGIQPERIIHWPLSWSPGRTPTQTDHVAAGVPRLVVSSWRGARHTVSPRSLAWLEIHLSRGGAAHDG